MQAQPANPLLRAVLERPKLLLPLLLVVGVMAVAFGVQPGGSGHADAVGAGVTPGADTTPAQATSAPSPTPTRAVETPTAAASGTAVPAGPTSDVAGVRGTPAATATLAPDYSRETTQCGQIQETALALSVEQSLGGVAVRATRAAVYPVEYFRCMLMAAGSRESISLAASIGKAQDGGATHAVLVDLWMTNGSREFGQLNLRTASLAAAGQSFAPLATLGGRSEVVVSSGQGRGVTLVAAVTNTVGTTTGPITLTIDAPLAGGQQTAGKYQLFLPTP